MDGVTVQKQRRVIEERNKKIIERQEEGGFGIGVFERMGVRGRKDS